MLLLARAFFRGESMAFCGDAAGMRSRLMNCVESSSWAAAGGLAGEMTSSSSSPSANTPNPWSSTPPPTGAPSAMGRLFIHASPPHEAAAASASAASASSAAAAAAAKALERGIAPAGRTVCG